MMPNGKSFSSGTVEDTINVAPFANISADKRKDATFET
jgi:hypothetical protein